MEKKNIFRGRDDKQRRKRRIISGKGKYVFHRGEEKQRSLDTWSVEGGTG